MQIVVMASGSGSNFEAIASACALGKIDAKVVSLIVDKPECGAIERANRLGINVDIVDFKSYSSKLAYEQAIVHLLNEYNPDFICLAGYMKIITETILDQYSGRIINIHPSLLPKYPGKQGLLDALNAGEKTVGVTVHYVDGGVDTGQIIKQASFPIKQMNQEEIETKLHAVEHELYVSVLRDLTMGER